MQITSSAFQTSVIGMQAGQQQVTAAASGIAQAGQTPAAEVTDPAQLQQAGNLEALTTHLLQLDLGRQQVEASAKAFRSADEVMGTLVDTRA